MTENEFDQDIEAQAKQFQDHDKQVDRLNTRISKLETQLANQAEELDSLLLKEKRWNSVLSLVGFNLGGYDPITFETNDGITEHVVTLAVPRMVQLIRLGEHFETIIRAAETNEITRNQLQQLAATFKLAAVEPPTDSTV